jgi:hypothetical protein
MKRMSMLLVLLYFSRPYAAEPPPPPGERSAITGGVNGQLGVFVPFAPLFGLVEGRVGVRLGSHLGLSFQSALTFSWLPDDGSCYFCPSSGPIANLALNLTLSVLAELVFERLAIAAGPALSYGKWGGRMPQASQISYDQGLMPAVDFKVTWIFGRPKPNGRITGLLVGFDGLLVLGSNQTTHSVVAFAPSLLVGFGTR